MATAGPLTLTGLPPDPEQYGGWKEYATALSSFFAGQSKVSQGVQPQAVQLAHFNLAAAEIKSRPRALSDGLLAYDVASSRAILSLSGAWKKLLTDDDGSFGSYYDKTASDARFVNVAGDTMTGGLSFGSVVAASPTDLSAHLALYGTTFGFSATSGRLNYVTASASGHHFIAGTADTLSITSGMVTASGNITLANTSPQFRIEETDQTDPAGRFRFYASLGNFYFQRASSAAWGGVTSLWAYTAGADFTFYSPLVANSTLDSVGATQLVTAGGTLSVGGATSAAVKLMRTSSNNYIDMLASTALVVRSVTTAWASLTSAAGWTAGSDVKLKRNVAPIHYGLDTVMAMQPVQFDWRADGRHDIGFIAQDMLKLVPEVIDILDDDNEAHTSTLAMRKDALVAVLVRAVQELAAEVRGLRRE